MLKREIPTGVFIAIVILALIIAVAIVWRKSSSGGQVVLEKAEKPYPVPPIFQKQQTR